MLAVVNRPRIEIRANKIPAKLISFMRREYPSVVIHESENESTNFRELEWFKETRAAMTPAENLKLLREERLLTQKELANKSGIALARILDYENGSAKISKSAAEKLAKILDTAEENLYW
jgi:DNA-binding XRE family transcriptional regulator